LQPEPSLPLQHPADSGIINPELEVAVDVCADVSLEAHPFLPLQYPADRGRNDSLPEVAVTVDAELSASTSTAQVGFLFDFLTKHAFQGHYYLAIWLHIFDLMVSLLHVLG